MSDSNAPRKVSGPDARRVRLLGLDLEDWTLAEAAHAITAAADSGRSTVVYFVNAHCYNVARRNLEYRRSLRSATWLLPDGSGVRWAAQLFRTPLRDNPNGTDLFPYLCDRAAVSGNRLFLLGGRPGIAEKMARRLKTTWPDLMIAGTLPGEFEEKRAGKIVEAVRVSRPDVLFVAGGVPVQEVWIERYRDLLEVPVILGVGGLFDFFAGEVSRAPLALRRAGLEWTWRLLQEPQRLWQRYLIGNPDFMAWVAYHRLRGGGLPSEEISDLAPISVTRTRVASNRSRRTPRSPS